MKILLTGVYVVAMIWLGVAEPGGGHAQKRNEEPDMERLVKSA